MLATDPTVRTDTNARTEIPCYSLYDRVPANLFTAAQLRAMNPSRVPAPDAQPVARRRYEWNRWVNLYDLAATVERRRATPAQAEAARRACALRRVCRGCGCTASKPLGRGRLCPQCWDAVWAYVDQRDAQRLGPDPAGPWSRLGPDVLTDALALVGECP